MYMRKKISKIFSKLILFLFLIFSGFMFSQPPPPFDDDVNDEALPIDSNIIILCALGVGLGFYVQKKSNTIKFTKK